MTTLGAGRALVAVGLLVVLGMGHTQSGRVSLTYGSIWSTAHFAHGLELELAACLSAGTDGRVTMAIFPGSQLGSEREMTESVNLGIIDMTSGGGAIQGYVPQVGLFYLPYLYDDFDHFQRVWTLGASPVADHIAELVEQETGIKVLGYSLGGIRDIISRNRPIRELADYRGLRIRVDDAPTSYDTFNALGASPVPMAFAEVYSGLQTSILDAAENPPANMVSMRWYEQAQHVSLTGHLMVLQLEMINKNTWNRLDAEAQDTLTGCMVEHTASFAEQAFAARNSSIQQLRDLGMQVTEVDDIREFATAVQGLHQSFVSTHDLSEYFEWIVGR